VENTALDTRLDGVQRLQGVAKLGLSLRTVRYILDPSPHRVLNPKP